MIQLTFQPAFDPYHAMYRCVRLLVARVSDASIHRDLYRILDFYMLFPFRMEAIRLRQDDTWIRATAKQYRSYQPYGPMPDDSTLFHRMRPIQAVALETLAREAYIDVGALNHDEVQKALFLVPSQMLDRIREVNSREVDVIKCLLHLAEQYPLTGNEGLKARTGLLEYRYDAV